MIAKGNLHAHGQKLAAYLITGKMHERAELVELKGFASSNIRDAFTDVMIQAEATRCEKPFYHAHVRLPDGEALTREQWLHVSDRIERALGFEGQGRAVAFHVDRHTGERHLHVAWSRIDLEQMKAIDPGLYKNKLKQQCRQLEKELGLTIVRNERDPEQKTLSAGRSEFEQARRLGTNLTAIREDIRACWERSDNGRSFETALAECGYVLARGDRRDFVIIDPAAGEHALAKRITGATAAETRARLADIDKANLPSVAQAKAFQVERQAGRELPAIEREPRRGFADAARAATGSRVIEREPEGGNSVSRPLPPAPDIRSAGDAGNRLGGGVIGAAFHAVASLFEGLFSSQPAKSEEQKREEITAEQQAKADTAQEAAAKEAYFRMLLDQMARDDTERRQRDQDMRERDDDRGRERER